MRDRERVLHAQCYSLHFLCCIPSGTAVTATSRTLQNRKEGAADNEELTGRETERDGERQGQGEGEGERPLYAVCCRDTR
jgi:hypothetical protein